jgi:peptidoglycan/xylan/chitin deacetylase (PgdA/CDA1 family)
VLASRGVQGVFFLPTAFIGTNRFSWWDTIAYIIRRSRKQRFRLGVPPFREFDLDAMDVRSVITRVLDVYRRGNGGERGSEPFVAMLEEACGSPRPEGLESCFMNWDEAGIMLRGGMAIGSHAHSHEILAGLSEEEQLMELATSKRILEERLGAAVSALAYPVGLPESYSPATRAAAVKAGYRMAFSFHGGFNRYGRIEPYNVRRFGLSARLARFQLQAAWAAATARGLY